MKILVISHEYPPIGGGGGKVVQDLCLGLAKRGHQIHLLTARFGKSVKMELAKNMTVERLPSWRTQPYRADLKAMGMFVLKSIIRGLKIARSWRPDLIHAHFAVPAGASARYLSKLTGIPYILTAHGGDVPGGAPEKTARWFRLVLPSSKAIWRDASRVAAVSSGTRDLALAHYDAGIRVIPNGIDTHFFKPVNLDPHTPPRILFIGRFSPEKNAAAVPEILARLGPLDWKCCMIGDGVQMRQVREKIAEKSLSERIDLVGWLNPEDVMSWLAKSDILLMPSLREGMPMAGLQALAMGLALILPRIGGCPDLVQGNGFLVEPGDLEGNIKALEDLLKDQKLLADFRKKSRKLSARFDISGTIDAYEQMLKIFNPGQIE